MAHGEEQPKDLGFDAGREDVGERAHCALIPNDCAVIPVKRGLWAKRIKSGFVAFAFPL
jgi:hypothetical protein